MTLKNERVITPVFDVISLNRASHQLTKKWQLWGSILSQKKRVDENGNLIVCFLKDNNAKTFLKKPYCQIFVGNSKFKTM